MRIKSMKAALFYGAAASAMLWSGVAQAQQHNFNVPSEDAVEAIPEFARQAGIQIVTSADQIRGVKTPTVNGDLETRAALHKLLAGTGLEIASDDGQTIILRSARKNVQAAQIRAAATANEGDTESVLVTGTRLQENDSAIPTQTYTRGAIIQSGRSTVAEFLNTLPDVSISLGEGDVQKFVGQTTVQLHGLPAGTTLVLLDGEKVAPGMDGYFDLSNIPLAMIDRIDVVPVGSSAIYGSDALAGAVNFVSRKDFDSLELNARYGTAAHTDEKDIDAAWGMTWGDKASVAIFANYQAYSALFGRYRAVTNTPYNPAGAPAIATSKACNPANISSLNGANLPGLNSSHAVVPVSSTGQPTIADFQATAGQTSYCGLETNSALIPDEQRGGAFLNGHYELNPSVDIFAKLMFSTEHASNEVGNFISLSSNTYVATANNPYNPFGQSVNVNYGYPGIPKSYVNNQQFARAELGARGDLFADWNYVLTGSYAQTGAHVSDLQPTPSVLSAALSSSDPATALNPFTTGAPGSPALLQSIVSTATRQRYRYVEEFTDVQGTLRGSILSLPAGTLDAVFGGEWYRDGEQSLSPFGATPSLGRSNYSLFTEERLPLLSGTQPGEQMLALNFAARYDNSSDFGGETTWQSGLEFRPVPDLLIRGGYATSFEAPQLSQIEGGISGTFTATVSDPNRGGQVYDVTETQGANPNLKPETGRSLTLGAVYNSSTIPGLETSVTWFRISISNYIGALGSAQVLLNYANLFPGAIVRGAPTPADTAAGNQGPITLINDYDFNFGGFDVSGIDFNAKYAVETAWGTFTPSIALTYTYKWTSALTPGAPVVSYLNQATHYGPGYAPAWKGNMGLAWNSGPYAAVLTGRYIGQYKDYQDFFANNNKLGSVWYTDANVKWEIGQSLLSDQDLLNKTYIQVGAVNLFNVLPKPSFNEYGYDPNEADIRGQFIYLQLGIHI